MGWWSTGIDLEVLDTTRAAHVADKAGRRPMGLKRGSAIVPPPKPVTSRKHARKLTTTYHSITHKLAAAKTDAEREACEAELEKMGGVEAYQRASALNTALNPTSKWVKRALAARKLGHTPRVLEIGAINTQLPDTMMGISQMLGLPRSSPTVAAAGKDTALHRMADLVLKALIHERAFAFNRIA